MYILSNYKYSLNPYRTDNFATIICIQELKHVQSSPLISYFPSLLQSSCSVDNSIMLVIFGQMQDDAMIFKENMIIAF